MTHFRTATICCGTLYLATLAACGTAPDGPAAGGAAGQAQGGASGGAASAAGTGATLNGGSSFAGSAGSVALCSAFTPCGGDLLGRWSVTKACATASTSKAIGDELKICPGGSINPSVSASGFIEFNAQGILKFDTVTHVHVVERVPAGCVAGLDCTGVQAALASRSGSSGATCQATATGCDCTYDVSKPHREEASYVASGTSYTETNAGSGDRTVSDYCVDGASLRTSDDEAVVELVRTP